MSIDFDALGLTDIIRLQNQLSQVLKRRFERPLGLCFTDIVGSSAYCARFGDEAGRALQQRHLDLVEGVLGGREGRIVDTAGDGAFLSFPRALAAAEAMMDLENAITLENAGRSREHQLVVRVGMHWGNVLTDGQLVTGDAVNLCARVSAAAEAGELWLTRDAFMELPGSLRLRCRSLPATPLKGFAEPPELLVFDWRDRSRFPVAVRIEETGEEIRLPNRDTLSFGRLRDRDGVTANDVVLTLPDRRRSLQISRWHFELRRRPDGFVLRPISQQPTEVDGVEVPVGDEVPVRPGTTVLLSHTVTLTFVGARTGTTSSTDETIGP
jgi:class 3 adenylate cyclase